MKKDEEKVVNGAEGICEKMVNFVDLRFEKLAFTQWICEENSEFCL